MLDGTLTFDIDYMVFVAPNPQLADKFFALISPLDSTVWLFILVSFLIVTAALVALAKAEEMVIVKFERLERKLESELGMNCY